MARSALTLHLALLMATCVLPATARANDDESMPSPAASAGPVPLTRLPEMWISPLRFSDEAHVRIRRPRPRGAALLLTSAEYYSLFGIPFVGTGIELGLGVDRRFVEVAILAHVFAGQSQAGLSAAHPQLDVMLNFITGRVRFGLGINVGVFGIQRITTSEWNWVATLGAQSRLSVDIVQWGPRAMFVMTRVGATTYERGGAVFDGSLGLGVRL